MPELTKEEVINSAKLDYRVLHLPLPDSFNGCYMQTNKGEDIILINCNKSEAEQIKTYIHELTHLRNKHIDSNLQRKDIEAITDYLTATLIAELQEGKAATNG